MPILATVSRDFAPEVKTDPDSRALDFRSIDGTDVIEWTGSEWIITPGIQGIRLPPREVITSTVPGLAGGRLLEVRTGMREVVLPILVASDDGFSTHLSQLASLRQFVNHRTVDYATAEGTFDLVASSAVTDTRSLRCVYVDGMEGLEAGDDGMYSTFDVKLLAVDPYWHGQQWTTPTVSLPKVAPFLSNSVVDAFPRALSASVALGANMAVTVGGDVPSPPIIAGTGPWTSMHITSPQGLDVTIGAVGAGHTMLLDTGRQLQCLRDGVADWTLVGDSPQWRPLPPGDASISIVVAGATTATSARVYGTSLWETAW